MTDFNKEISVLREVEKARNALKRKYNDIKVQKLNVDSMINETFKPVVKPLEKLINVAEKNENYLKLSKVPLKKEKIEKSDNEINDFNDEDLKSTYDNFESAESGSEDDYNFDKTVVEVTDKENQFLELLLNNNTETLDTLYGIRKMKDGTLKIGNSVVNFDKHHVIIGDNKYNKSEGLLQLLFMKSPDSNLITDQDYQDYSQILENTNAYRKKIL